LARRIWSEELAGLESGRLVFVDETGASTKMARHYGRSKKGSRCHASILHGH
jgi:hypothetical protein